MGLVDLLKESRNGACRLAVVENGRPVVGMLYAPALNQSFTAVENKGAKFCDGGNVKECNIQEFGKILNVSSPKSYFDSLQQQSSREMKKVDSLPTLAWRLALIAKGEKPIWWSSRRIRTNGIWWQPISSFARRAVLYATFKERKLLYNQSDTGQNKFFACKESERENVQNMLKDIK